MSMQKSSPKYKWKFRTMIGIKSFLYVLFLSIFIISCSEKNNLLPPEKTKIKLKGFSYTSFTKDGFTQGNQITALEDLVNQTNSEWLSLCFFEYQTNPDSFDIAPNTTGTNPITGEAWPSTSTMDDIKGAILRARQENMKIMFKPHIDLYSGEWRAAITPDSEGKWFKSYTEMILKYAKLAEENNVEMLCIGVEYVVATQKKYSVQWRELIQNIRSVYSGKLTYAASFGNAASYGVSTNEFENIDFWDDLDYIGIDFYTALNYNFADFLAYDKSMLMVANSTNEIEKVSNKFIKNVILTEIGIQSVMGATQAPWNYKLGSQPGAIPDNDEQKFYYNVMLNSFAPKAWFEGFFWWNWESVISGNEKTNYTPRNKPAAELLKLWYTDN
jgi:hypothetical protein